MMYNFYICLFLLVHVILHTFLLQSREGIHYLDTLCSFWTALILRNKGRIDIILKTVFYTLYIYMNFIDLF